MQASTPDISSARMPPDSGMAWLAVAFTALGILSILAPAAAAIAATVLIAATLLFWGILGLWMSLSLRRFPEWKLSAAAFGAITLVGLILLVFPALGVEVMTLCLVAGFLIEGVFSVLIGLRLSAVSPRWGWMVASGVASLLLGFVVLVGWPETASWLLGLIIGVNFLTTGVALFALRSAIRHPAA